MAGNHFNSFTGSTIGSRIDAVIDSLDSLSSTQLYGLIVGLTVLITCIVLDSANHAEVPYINFSVSSPKVTNSTGPEPRWHIFQWVNVVAVSVFVWSVGDFSIHSNTYLNDQESSVLLKFLIGWSMLLCYFFGFFGVSFVHEMTAEQEKNPLIELEHSNGSMKNDTTDSKKKLASLSHSTQIPSDLVSSSMTPKKRIDENLQDLTDAEIANRVLSYEVKDHELEKRLDPFRAVEVRRLVVAHNLLSLGHGNALAQLPYKNDLDYSRVLGANCEIVVGYVPIPVGMVGPLKLNGESLYFPMATTEGCLVASTNRGVKAISQGKGAYAVIIRDGITRAPCVRLNSAMEAAGLKLWCERPENFERLKLAFESTTSFGKLKSCVPTVAGKNVYLRLICFSGDAMGMNMVSKGSLAIIYLLQKEFPSLQLVALSGNMCTDKKAAAVNWIEGRGKSVVVEATIPKDVVKSTLKTSPKALVETNLHKNLIGSAMAGTIGGFNAHASNIVTAIFLATGQDPAQNVESSNCITLLEEDNHGDLWISCTMPSLEVGTVGGGTCLPAQSACLESMGCRGGGNIPGENAQRLAMIIAAATMAGELSLLSALAANTLVAAHMQHNRKKQ